MFEPEVVMRAGDEQAVQAVEYYVHLLSQAGRREDEKAARDKLDLMYRYRAEKEAEKTAAADRAARDEKLAKMAPVETDPPEAA